jgi:hypothetical protein
MRKSRLWNLWLTGWLGLAMAAVAVVAAAAVEPPCPPEEGVSPAEQLVRCNGGFAERRRLVATFQRRLGLAGDAAVRLADFLAATDQALAHQGLEASGPEMRRIESGFIGLLAQAPENPVIADEMSWFYGRSSLDSPDPALLDLVARSPDPARLALRLSREAFNWLGGTQILIAALAVRPEPAVLWNEAARNLFERSSWKMAFYEEALRRLTAGGRKRPVDPDVATALAEALLDQQLQAGLAPRAIATLRSLPPAIRSRIEKGSTGNVVAEVDGLPFRGELRDLRLPLAAAYLLTGDPRTAAAWIARVPPKPDGESDAERTEKRADREIIARSLSPSSDDPFELLTSFLAHGISGVGVTGTGRLACARLAEREGYPAVAAYELRLQEQGDPNSDSDSDPGFDPSRGLNARVRAAAASVRVELDKLDRTLMDEEQGDRDAARAGLGPDLSAPLAAFVAAGQPGGVLSTNLRLFFFDRSGRRAYAEWDAGGSGGQDLLQENDDGTWKVEKVVDWMS